MPTDFLISVIDDDESFRQALVGSLGSLGYGTQSFASAEEFIAGGGEGSSDCIITDLHMRGMSGLDLIRQLAAQGPERGGRLQPGPGPSASIL